MTSPHKNQLEGSLSPYLLMHASNPVNWYPWGDEAFMEAQARDLFVFLSIGYAACHWCHVMEQECFSDPEVALLLNTHCISIKVDREERPDIDQMYMMASQLMTGSGGWPLSIFLTPNREPFYAATYIPKISRPGMVGMIDLIPYLADIWKNRRHEINDTGSNVIRAVTQVSMTRSGDPSKESIYQAFEYLVAGYDSLYGGFSISPKFPSVPQILFLFRYYHRYSARKAREMAEHTLIQMAVSGIRDPLDGGFFRYATDQAWKLPHFEKMLSDQALLAIAYCEGFRISHNPLFKTTAKGVLDYVCTSLTIKEGGFWSSMDADSPGGEGVYYLWTIDEVKQILGERDCTRFCAVYGLTPEGNVSGHGIASGSNVLHPGRDPITILQEQGIPYPEEWLTYARERLWKARKEKKAPAVDDKILTDWNGLMISALVQGYHTLECDQYYHVAVRAATCILKNLMPNSMLSHHWYHGRAGLHGMSGDYIFFAMALLDLFQADGDVKWMNAVIQLIHQLDFRFEDLEFGGYYTSDADGADLPVRLKDVMDNALPSINGMAALLMQRMACITGNQDYARKYEKIIRMTGGVFSQSSGAMLSFFSASMEHESGFRILVFFPDKSEDIMVMYKEVRSLYLPGSMIIPIFDPEAVSRVIPDIKGYSHKPALHICGNGKCFPPIFSKNEFSLWREHAMRFLVSDK